MRTSVLLWTAAFLLSVFSSVSYAQSLDTVTVQTLTYDSASRTGVYNFPANDGTSYEKVLMQYRMRCHNALVSNGTKTEQGCGQWDYNCETFIWDSTRVDSVKSTYPNYSISNWNGDFPYTTEPTHTIIRHDYTTTTLLAQKLRNYNDSFGQEVLPDLKTDDALRAIYLYHASELGMQAGDTLQAIRFDGLSNKLIQGLRIRIGTTTESIVNESASRDTSFVTVYYADSAYGISQVNFSTPIIYTGNNLLVEVTWAKMGPIGKDVWITGGSAGFLASLVSHTQGYALTFSGAESIRIPSEQLAKIHNAMTITFWAYGDPTQLPGASTILLEGVDTSNNRQVNIHLPWSDNNVYWDCGGYSNGSYDRISKALPSRFEAAGRWNHWAFVKNRVTGMMKIYLNGSLWASDTGKRAPIDIATLLLGHSPVAALGYLGRLQDFTMWNNEIDSGIIKRIMDSSITSTMDLSSLLVSYKLDEGVGSLIHDRISPLNNTTLSGLPVWRKTDLTELHRGLIIDSLCPSLTLYFGTSTRQVTHKYGYDTLLDPAHSVIHNAINPDYSIRVIDTTYKYLATTTYTYDENNVKVDSQNVNAQDTIRIEQLPYFTKGPQKVEIMSFVTPYGINLDLGKDGKMYEFDVTDYLPVLHGRHRLSMERGSGQEEFDIRFLFIKGKPARDVLDLQQIWPMTEEPYQSILDNSKYEPRIVNLEPNASGFKLRSMITGHGQEGEFITRDHYITVGADRYQWEVVKTCADNPLYPQGGTWIYTRAGWCPGAPTLLKEIELTGTVQPGTPVTMDYGVTTASGDSRYDPSNQLVSYSAPNFQLNAGVMQIERPSNRIEFGRINPACDLPIVVIRNNGAKPLTSLKIEYYVDGGPHLTYDWSGGLNFLDTESVVLPVSDVNFWGTNTTGTFHVDLSAPNGGTDEYDQDSHYSSDYTMPPVYSGTIVVNFRTNKVPEQNYFEVKDMSGNVVYTQTDFDPSTTYYDSLMLPDGCYTFIMHDDDGNTPGEGNGLSFFASPGDGNGTLSFRQSTKSGKILHTFNPDFGAFTQYDFSVLGSPLGAATPDRKYQLLSLYPNPAHSLLTLDLEGYPTEMITLELIDMTGKTVRREQRFTDNSGSLKADLDIHSLARGSYFLRTISKSGSNEKQFIVQ